MPNLCPTPYLVKKSPSGDMARAYLKAVVEGVGKKALKYGAPLAGAAAGYALLHNKKKRK